MNTEMKASTAFLCFGNNYSYSILPLATSRALSRCHCFVSTYLNSASSLACTVLCAQTWQWIICCQTPSQFFSERVKGTRLTWHHKMPCCSKTTGIELESNQSFQQQGYQHVAMGSSSLARDVLFAEIGWYSKYYSGFPGVPFRCVL